MHGFGDKPGQAEERSAQGARDEEYLLSEAEAPLAATLALMTGFGNGCCTAHRAAMAAKVADQLALLARAQGQSADMRAFLLRLGQRWQQAAAQAAASHAGAQPLAAHWHEPPQTLQ